MRPIWICVAVMALSVPGAAFAKGTKPVPAKPAIPRAFWGRWDFDNTLCKGPFDNWIDISADLIESGEDTSTVVSVTRLSPTRIRLVLDQYGELTSDAPPGSDAYAGRVSVTYALIDHGHTLVLTRTEGRKPVSARAGRCPDTVPMA